MTGSGCSAAAARRRGTLWVAWAVTVFWAGISAQRVGHWVDEVHPQLVTWQCTVAGGCQAKQTSVVIDSKNRWLHLLESPSKCTQNDNELNSTFCYDSETCYNNCAYEGISNYSTMGITTDNTTLRLSRYVDRVQRSPRVYLLDETGEQYEKIQLGAGTEMTYDVDVSMAPCGVVTTFYFVEMDPTGGKDVYNEGGAKYGTGYCDCQCSARSFLNGQVNTNRSGVCCSEYDFWEANRGGASMGLHPCKKPGVFAGTGKENLNVLLGGLCSKIGGKTGGGLFPSDYPDFYGVGKKVDTSKPLTVVTQFLRKSDLSRSAAAKFPKLAADDLATIRRMYIQNGTTFRVATSRGMEPLDLVITPDTIHDTALIPLGGLSTVDAMLKRGMVLAMSIFDTGRTWPCATYVKPTTTEWDNAHFIVSNIRWGEVNSTLNFQG